MKHLVATLILIASFSCNAVEVVSIEVNLFYQESGSFSENVLKAENFILWNTIIGEGSAGEPSDRFLVKVKIKGPKDKYIKEKVELTVKALDTGKTLYSEVYNGFLFPKSGIIYRASFVSGYNCRPLVITAGKLNEVVQFHCGE